MVNRWAHDGGSDSGDDGDAGGDDAGDGGDYDADGGDEVNGEDDDVDCGISVLGLVSSIDFLSGQ